MGAAACTILASQRAFMSRRQGGAIAVMFATTLVVIFGFMGLALDLSMVYNRKVEMQNAANTVALAAALELNGTQAGVTKASQKAAERFFTLPGTVVGGMSYQYSTKTMEWSDTAIEFGPTPNGPWVRSGTAFAQPDRMLYVRVDTQGLNPEYGEVRTMFVHILDSNNALVSVSGRAVAGPSAIRVTPFGVCAMRPEAARDHGGELEEYGFRRGVAYDLMQLNSEATTPARSYLINPFVPPGSTGVIQSADVSSVRPFICTGTMAMSRVTGGDVAVVSSPFPLNDLHRYFNSRFDSYTLPCRPETAPPDANVKKYIYNDTTAVPWMDGTVAGQAAAESLVGDKLWTIAGPDQTPADATAAKFGPLWSYAKAVRYSSYLAMGTPEPAAGYTTFTKNDWDSLYNPGKPKNKNYPSTTPYAPNTGANFESPTNTGVRGRRVLNIPLLACPVNGNRAQVLAVGKFFMTVPANGTALFGEFAGLAPEQSLGSQVKIYP